MIDVAAHTRPQAPAWLGQVPRYLGYTLLFLAALWLYRFIAVALAPINRPYLLRTFLQCLEGVWVGFLLWRLVKGGVTPGPIFERRMLLSLWALFGLWLCLALPMGFAARDAVRFYTPHLERYQSFLAVPTFEVYLLAIWLIAGLAGAVMWLWKRRFANVDEFLLPASLFLTAQGLLLLARLGPDLAKANRMAFFQAIYFLIGACVGGILLIPKVRERWVSVVRYPYLLLVAAVLLIGSTFVFGTALNGGKALWIVMGGFSFQPVELAKILFVLLMGTILERQAFRLQMPRNPAIFVSFGLICGVFFLTLFLQRDFGPILLLMLTVLILFLTVSRQWMLLPIAIIGAVSSVLAVMHFKWPGIVYARLLDSLDPLQHSGQLTAGLWAQGSGSLWGTGLGMSKVPRVPIVESDYIFSALIAEKGFVGTLFFLGVFTALAWRGAQLARIFGEAHKRDGTLVLGLATALFVQGFLIMAGNLALMPLTGITLPFVSAGGTGLVINLGVIFAMLALCTRNTFDDVMAR